jgi:hypothetical protein
MCRPKAASVKIPTPQLAFQQRDWLFMEKPKEIFSEIYRDGLI